jgi:hypothetical protein
MKTLHLTLKKKWFDMIASGEKKEEYREVKPYWINRFTWHEYHKAINNLHTLHNEIFSNSHSVPDNDVIKNRFYDLVQFRNGYAKDAPTITVQCLGIEIGPAKPGWSDNWQGDVFVIKLGDIIN